MAETLPRIASVDRTGPTLIAVSWQHGPSDRIDLAGWIGTGGAVLDPLSDSALFGTVRVGEYGASVEWGDPDGDLAIDAEHLHRLAIEQRPFGHRDLAAWQAKVGMSNQEAAEFLSVSLSSWNAYKAGSASVPAPVAMVCRAALRDSILLQAHYRPRKSGRPRKVNIS
ncbi:hypothetical protein [uncultured Methylobacterium sp.]|uniref:hypothetical protein n=1 Tax=uncultured Methylobacterium sp. TaxID=157278 RepID=UPI0035CAE53F